MARSSWRVNGHRSGLEDKVKSLLLAADFVHGYEENLIRYVMPESNHRYTPDFRPFKEKPIYLETKGPFSTADRKKMKLVVEQHPDKMFIMLFGRAANTITKKSKTTYGMWCDQHGIRWMDFKDFKLDPKKCLLSTIQQQIVGKLSTPRQKKSKVLKASVVK